MAQSSDKGVCRTTFYLSGRDVLKTLDTVIDPNQPPRRNKKSGDE